MASSDGRRHLPIAKITLPAGVKNSGCACTPETCGCRKKKLDKKKKTG